MPAESVIEQAIEQIADGLPVDWPRLDREARSDDERESLKSLRILGTIADVHRSAPDAVEANPEASTYAAILPSSRSASDRDEMWGRYRLVEKVGEGSFGSVHRAWDPELEWEIAIKILHRHVADDELKERLKREGRALARVQHPNVVRVLGIESHGDRVGLCMEFVRGETLEAGLASKGTLNAREAVLVGEDVCRALAAVHRAGFVHRDVKARNVMRDRAGRIVLMDFGTGRQADHLRLAGPLDTAGTPLYMAPEVLAGEVASGSSDVYSVGVLLYHLVTAEYPVEGRTMNEVRAAHMQGRRRALSDRRPDLPLPFIQVVERALAADPAQRLASAGAFLEALGNLDHEAPRTVRTKTSYALASVAAVVAAASIVAMLGIVNSRFFNSRLGRSDFANETIRDWLYWGAVSSVAPVVLFTFTLLALALVVACTRMLLKISATARHAKTALNVKARGLHLDDVSMVSSCALLVSASLLIGAWWYFAPLIEAFFAMSPSIGTAPLENLALLSPQFNAYHEAYRASFTWVTILCVVLWYPVMKLAAQKRESLHRGVLLGGVAVVLLALVFLDFPYRLLYFSEFETVKWEGSRCYMLGERASDLLLFCPELQAPRNRTVPRSAAGLERLGVRADILASFSTNVGRRP